MPPYVFLCGQVFAKDAWLEPYATFKEAQEFCRVFSWEPLLEPVDTFCIYLDFQQKHARLVYFHKGRGRDRGLYIDFATAWEPRPKLYEYLAKKMAIDEPMDMEERLETVSPRHLLTLALKSV